MNGRQALLLFLTLTGAWLIVFFFAIAPAHEKKRDKIKYQLSTRPMRLPSGQIAPFDPAFALLSPADLSTLPATSHWERPLGTESGALVYDAQPFLDWNQEFGKKHLGSDLNGIGGENTDKSDPVFCAAAGRVIYAGMLEGGWGNMVIVAHALPPTRPGEPREIVQSVYAHLDRIDVAVDQEIPRGHQLGLVGDANGRYFAHLHLEIRRAQSVFPSVGYHVTSPLNRLAPLPWIDERSTKDPKLLCAAPTPPLGTLEIIHQDAP